MSVAARPTPAIGFCFMHQFFGANRPSSKARGLAYWSLAIVGLIALDACTPQDQPSTERPSVVATVAPIADLVSQIGGSGITTWGIIPEGVDSHTFEPSARDAAKIAQAELVFMNGLNLELPTKRMALANTGGKVVELASEAVAERDWIFDQDFPEARGDPNPHLWTNPPYVIRFCDQILEELISLRPRSETVFRSNHQALTDKIRALDEAIRTATATVPPERRRLLTYHDSFPYFAREYGWTVAGAIQPADFSEPSPKEVAALIEQIKQEKVPAIFGSEVFPSPVLEQIARDTGARYVADLSDDDLPGDAGDPEHTYLGMMRKDVVTMVEALGGDASALRALDVRRLPR